MPPTDTPALFPKCGTGSQQPVKARRKSALSWSPEENQFAAWLIATWNAAFKNTDGGKLANNVRGNNSAAIFFYRRLCRMPPGLRFSADDIAAAIQGYADNPVNKKLQSFTWFRTFAREAEDRITAELRRVGRRIGASDSLAAAARRLWERRRLGYQSKLAEQMNEELSAERFQSCIRSIDARKRIRPSDQMERRHYAELLALALRFGDLPPDDRAAYRQRAEKPFRILSDRASDPRDLADRNALTALALALFDLDPNRAREKAADSPEAVK